MTTTRYVFSDYITATEWLKRHGFGFELTPSGEERMGAEMRRQDGATAFIQASGKETGIEADVRDAGGKPIENLEPVAR